jgi:hypothetical protein
MKKYVWAWADDDGNYINEAESLSEILDDVLDYYLSDYKQFEVTERDGQFLIQIEMNEQSSQYKIEVSPEALGNFLNQLATIENRCDKFTIQPRSL